MIAPTDIGAARSNHSRRIGLCVLAALAATVAACSAPAIAEPDVQVRERSRTDMVCLNSAIDAPPADTVSVGENGSCPTGFDMVPWY